MNIYKNGLNWVVKLQIGEEFINSLVELARAEDIRAAGFQAIGAFNQFELGFYMIDQKQYIRKSFKENVELLSCNGTLALREGEPVAHAHVSLGRQDFTVIGGHLFSGVVSVTAEIVLRKMEEELLRTFDEITGLYLLNLPIWKAL